MNLIISYLIISLLSTTPVKEKQDLFTVSGVITTSGSYCGGMAPTEEMLRRVQAKRPMSGFMIYVKKGTENKLSSRIIDSTYTNSKGEYSFELPKGDYVLLRKNQLDKAIFKKYQSNNYLMVDQDCMEKWWNKGLTSISVENENIDNQNFHFGKRCFIPDFMSCVSYTGPYPP